MSKINKMLCEDTLDKRVNESESPKNLIKSVKGIDSEPLGAYGFNCYELARYERQSIVEFCKQEERRYANGHNPSETRIIFFNINDKSLSAHFLGEKLDVKRAMLILQGVLVEVYRFETNRLEDLAMKNLQWNRTAGEVSELFQRYFDDQDGLDDISDIHEEWMSTVDPWLNAFMEGVLEEKVKIDIKKGNTSLRY